MAFLDELGRKVSEVGQKTIQKTNDFSANAKLNSAIAESEKIIAECYTQIGRLYYEQHRNDCEDMFTDLVYRVNEEHEKIQQFRTQKQELGFQKTCSQCGTVLPAKAAFCHACGAKQSSSPADPADGSAVTCQNCGALMPEGTSFCMNCGNPLVKEEPTKKPTLIEYPPKPRGIICPSCGTEVEEGNRFCTSCGKELAEPEKEPKALQMEADDPETAAGDTEADEEETVLCTSCGAQVPVGMRCCISCGFDLESIIPQPDEVQFPDLVPEDTTGGSEGDPATEPEAEDEDSDEWTVCPECGANVPAGNRFCIACGANMDASVSEEKIVEMEPETRDKEMQVVLCMSCGAEVPEGNQYCNVCGFDLYSVSNAAGADRGDETVRVSSPSDIVENPPAGPDVLIPAMDEAADMDTGTSCPSCGEPVKEGNKFCVRCGAKLLNVPENGIGPKEMRKYCAKCGSPVMPGNMFCTVCGTHY